jgi:hypothetical protein
MKKGPIKASNAKAKNLLIFFFLSAGRSKELTSTAGVF